MAPLLTSSLKTKVYRLLFTFASRYRVSGSECRENHQSAAQWGWIVVTIAVVARKTWKLSRIQWISETIVNIFPIVEETVLTTMLLRI